MPKTSEQLYLEDARLKLIQILYESEAPLRAKTVRSLLDDFNYSFTWDGFIRQVSWLVSEKLIHCFPDDLSEEPNEVTARKYVGFCLRASFDSKESGKIMLKIRSKGRHFLEGNADEVRGVATP